MTTSIHPDLLVGCLEVYPLIFVHPTLSSAFIVHFPSHKQSWVCLLFSRFVVLQCQSALIHIKCTNPNLHYTLDSLLENSDSLQAPIVCQANQPIDFPCSPNSPCPTAISLLHAFQQLLTFLHNFGFLAKVPKKGGMHATLPLTCEEASVLQG